jgi:hypothetical protein
VQVELWRARVERQARADRAVRRMAVVATDASGSARETSVRWNDTVYFLESRSYDGEDDDDGGGGAAAADAVVCAGGEAVLSDAVSLNRSAVSGCPAVGDVDGATAALGMRECADNTEPPDQCHTREATPPLPLPQPLPHGSHTDMGTAGAAARSKDVPKALSSTAGDVPLRAEPTSDAISHHTDAQKTEQHTSSLSLSLTGDTVPLPTNRGPALPAGAAAARVGGSRQTVLTFSKSGLTFSTQQQQQQLASAPSR